MRTASVSSDSDRLHCREALTCCRPADVRLPLGMPIPEWRHLSSLRSQVGGASRSTGTLLLFRTVASPLLPSACGERDRRHRPVTPLR